MRSGTQPENIPHSGPLLGEPPQSATLAALPDLTLLPEQVTSAHAMLHGRKTCELQSMSDVWVTRYSSSVNDKSCYVNIPCKLASREGMLKMRSLHDRRDLPACRSGTGQQKGETGKQIVRTGGEVQEGTYLLQVAIPAGPSHNQCCQGHRQGRYGWGAPLSHYLQACLKAA